MRKIILTAIVATFLLSFIGCGSAEEDDLSNLSAADLAKKYKADADGLKGKEVTVTGTKAGGSDFADHTRIQIGDENLKGKVLVYCTLGEKLKDYDFFKGKITVKGKIEGGETDGNGQVDLKPCEIVK